MSERHDAPDDVLTDDPRAELAEVAADLALHLRWRLANGVTRLPAAPADAAAEAGRAPAAAGRAPAAAGRAPAAAGRAPAAADRAPAAAGRAPAAPPPAAPADSGPLGWKHGVSSPALRTLREDLGDCTRCKLAGGRTNLVFGTGNPDADLVFVGEGPGRDEDLQGEPFVGRAGELLTKMIVAMGYQRSDVYICNVVKCRPPDNRDPEPDEAAACEPFLAAQLAAIRPKVIVALGRFAVQFLLGDPAARITKVRGRWAEYQGVPVMPTFHPAYLLRTPAAKREAWADLQEVMKRLGRTP